jgi:hypothetical protein
LVCPRKQAGREAAGRQVQVTQATDVKVARMAQPSSCVAWAAGSYVASHVRGQVPLTGR